MADVRRGSPAVRLRAGDGEVAVRRSARSVPTGIGSRGGRGHRPPPEYWREWRAAHPEYRERERLRKAAIRARRNDARPAVAFTDVIRSLLSRASTHEMGRVLLIDHTAVLRIRTTDRKPHGETIDAVVAVFGISEVLREWQRLRAVARDRREADAQVSRLAPPSRSSWDWAA